MTIQEKQQELVETFNFIEDWEEKYKEIIRFGRELPELPQEYKTEKYKLNGCQSQVWIHAELDDKGNVNFQADSDAMIVKGLIAMLIDVYSNQPPEDILESNDEFLKEIGIDKHLSPTRKNGLGSMMKQIQMYAVAFKSMKEKAN